MRLRDTKRDFTDIGNDFLTFFITVFASFVTRYVSVLCDLIRILIAGKRWREREMVIELKRETEREREGERGKEREREREKEMELKRERFRKRKGQKKVDANILRKVKRCGALRKCPPPVGKLENIALKRKITISSNFLSFSFFYFLFFIVLLCAVYSIN